MTNNEIFGNILKLTGLSLKKDLTVSIFQHGGVKTTKLKIKSWRTAIGGSNAERMPDKMLNAFFDGLYKYRDQRSGQGVNVFNFAEGDEREALK